MNGELSALIGGIYDAALDRGHWENVLTLIADYCGAENAALVVVNPRIALSHVLSPRADPRIIEEYGRTWWQHDPTARATAAIAPGVITDLGTTGRETFINSLFHNEFWARSGLGTERLATNLFTDGEAFGSFVLQASVRRDELTLEMRQRFGHLVPHILRAVRTEQRLLELQRAQFQGTQGNVAGIVMVDTDARPVWADTGGAALLSGGTRMRIVEQCLCLAHPDLTRALHSALRRTGTHPPGDQPDEPVSLFTGYAEVPQVNVLPLSAFAATRLAGSFVPRACAALVFVNPRHGQAEMAEALARIYSLTPAEARLVIEIAQGDGRAAAARRLGISVHTVRTQLSSVFGKMNVNRQSELIRLIGSGFRTR